MNSQKVVDLLNISSPTTNGQLPYQQLQDELRYFASIAEQIVNEIKPQNALDVGCGLGFLVEDLRQRGVDAFGVDISDYAIRQVHLDIQPYCWVGSVIDPLPRKYDLITCIEVLEHLSHSEAKQGIENLCQYSDDILFSSTPLDYKELTHFNVRPPEYWAELFAHHGFFHDIEFDASFITPWAIRFRRAREPITQIIAAYERRFWQLWQENQARRELGLEQRNELSAKEYQLVQKEQIAQMLREQVNYWKQLEASPGWALLQKLQLWRANLAPPGSVRDQCLDDIFRAWRTRQLQPLAQAVHRIQRDLAWQAKVFSWRSRLYLHPPPHGRVIQVDEVQTLAPIQSHQGTVEIIICIHNALTEVKNCLQSVTRHTTPPYKLILVDDGSDLKTRNYLAEFVKKQKCVLLRNEKAKGYTTAANQGLRCTSVDYVILLNSDTVVTSGWLDRLISCAESDPRIGLIGPLSNTASWQSIPEIESAGDWAANPLPSGLTIDQTGQLVAHYSARLYPFMPFLNGFCLLIRQQTLQEVGHFDEENFGAGYGEENDYALRARQAGWRLALADNAYVYHAQSRSYSNERRQQLSERANTMLAQKHGQQIISEGVVVCRQDRVLEGIRARSRAMFIRQEWIQKGHAKFAGRRVLFVLPVFRAGGGANIIIDEARAMRQMGVDVRIFNLVDFRQKFERSYPDLEIPILFGEKKHLPTLVNEYDAVIATFHASVAWLAPIIYQNNRPVRGYYIQDFEPYMYSVHAEGYQAAWTSYTLIPDLVRFTKTEWTQQEVKSQVNVECSLIGVSLNLDLFRPRPRFEAEWPERPLRIAAMVRADSPHRAPELTMKILERASRRYRAGIEITIFGTELDDPGFSKLPRNFTWNLAGLLNQKQVAQFLNNMDIFVDFSTHQAMGLTALEAMACGAAVIVPERGGAISFARHEENSLVIDTSSQEACWDALERLIEDHHLRSRLQKKALIDVCSFFPERPAFNILNVLFNPEARTS